MQQNENCTKTDKKVSENVWMGMNGKTFSLISIFLTPSIYMIWSGTQKHKHSWNVLNEVNFGKCFNNYFPFLRFVVAQFRNKMGSHCILSLLLLPLLQSIIINLTFVSDINYCVAIITQSTPSWKQFLILIVLAAA